MTSTIISASAGLVTGINVFTVAPEREAELLDTLRAIDKAIVRHALPMNVSASFHRAIDGGVVLNYNQYTDRENIHVLRSIPETAPLRKRTHDLSDTHEIRWYEVGEIVTADPSIDHIEIAGFAKAPAVIGIFTATPGRQAELLAALKRYGEELARAKTPGFVGIATHRGYEPAQVALYEQWQSVEAYRAAMKRAAVADLADRARQLTTDALWLPYEVLDVARFDLERQAAATRAG